ncbi:MAG: hypothetical protein AB7Y46_08300 [Armatimonadota bacterium]
MAAALLVCSAGLVASCGIRGGRATLDQVSVTQYRYVVDESEDVVRVVGLVRNGGQERTPPGEIVVTLRSRTGSMKGQNRGELPPLEGGEERRFALAVTSHGNVESVEITIVPRGTAEGGAGEEAQGDRESAEAGSGEGVGSVPSNSADHEQAPPEEGQ